MEWVPWLIIHRTKIVTFCIFIFYFLLTWIFPNSVIRSSRTDVPKLPSAATTFLILFCQVTSSSSLLSTWTIKILSTSFHAQFVQTALNVTVCQEVLPFLSYSPCEKTQNNKFPEPFFFSLQLSAAHSSVWSPCCEQRRKHRASKDSPRIQTFTWHMVLWPTWQDWFTSHFSWVATAWVDEMCFLYFSWNHQPRNQV